MHTIYRGDRTRRTWSLLAAALILPALVFAGNQGGNNQGGNPRSLPEESSAWVLGPLAAMGFS
jgi:hypothetical protein